MSTFKEIQDLIKKEIYPFKSFSSPNHSHRKGMECSCNMHLPTCPKFSRSSIKQDK